MTEIHEGSVRRPRADELIARLTRELEEARKCCRWEADNQRNALEYWDGEYGTSLAEEFPFGCDTIEHVAEALIVARQELEEARERERRVRSAVIRANAALVRLDLRWDPREEAEWVRRRPVVAIATRLGDEVLAALRSGSGSPPGEGERANCRCAPAAPWRSDGATCPDWPGCGNPDWRPATPQEAGE